MCLSLGKLLKGEAPDKSLKLKSLLSVVSEDMHSDGAKKRLISKIDPDTTLHRPKLLGFHKASDPDRVFWAVYLGEIILFDDQFHLTESIAMALLHLEIVRTCLSPRARAQLHVILNSIFYMICIFSFVEISCLQFRVHADSQRPLVESELDSPRCRRFLCASCIAEIHRGDREVPEGHSHAASSQRPVSRSGATVPSEARVTAWICIHACKSVRVTELYVLRLSGSM